LKLATRLSAISLPLIVRVACVLALLALATMVVSVLVPRPLPVILAMSIGHALGGLAFICYLGAVIIDAARSRSKTD
jgi:hypothetical protein